MQRLALQLDDYCNCQFRDNYALERLTLSGKLAGQSSSLATMANYDDDEHFSIQALIDFHEILDRSNQQVNGQCHSWRGLT
tara:strand:+ start:770 stop:1012 length:243 start_codon:yes stop_codon:yes gene_type:complete